MTRAEKKALPWLLVTRITPTRRGPGVAHVWCPYCHIEHAHGAMGSPRAAHCADDSPLEESGYLIVAPKVLIKSLPVEQRALWKGYTR